MHSAAYDAGYAFGRVLVHVIELLIIVVVVMVLFGRTRRLLWSWVKAVGRLILWLLTFGAVGGKGVRPGEVLPPVPQPPPPLEARYVVVLDEPFQFERAEVHVCIPRWLLGLQVGMRQVARIELLGSLKIFDPCYAEPLTAWADRPDVRDLVPKMRAWKGRCRFILDG